MRLVRGIFEDNNLPIELYGGAVNTFVYIMNRPQIRSLEGACPYEKWMGRKPNIEYLRVFT